MIYDYLGEPWVKKRDPLLSPCKGEAGYPFFFSEKWKVKSEKSRWRNSKMKNVEWRMKNGS